MKTIKTLTSRVLVSAALIGLAFIGAHGQTTFQKTFSASATGGGSPSIITGKSSVKQTDNE
ncbi:MAG: hypothetical protein FVQ77_03915 [Cytophagales bacterium]|nr:hypothetical protein [Cytophagales bacterium]